MYKYNKKGFIIGVPARDLTDAEAALYRSRPGFSKLYIKAAKRIAAKAKEKKYGRHQGT